MDELLRRIRYYLRRRRFEAELDEEMQHHLAMKAADVADPSGASDNAPAGAASARRQFGNLTRLKEDSRSMWTSTLIEQLVQDLRYAARSMRKNPVFTSLAALSLALGIGANTAIYSFTDSILLRSLPVPHAEELVTLNWTLPPPPEGQAKGQGPVAQAGVIKSMMTQSGASYQDPRTGYTGAVFPYAAFELFQSADSPFASVFAYVQAERLHVLADGRTDVAGGYYVSGGYFSGLRIVPAAGRLVDAGDDRTGAPPVAVLSYGYWTRRFGRRADVVGQTVEVNRQPVTVVGVAPPEFFGLDPAFRPDLYFPLHAAPVLEDEGALGYFAQAIFTDRNFYWLEMMGRLRPGAAIEQAQAALAPGFRQFVDGTAANDEQRRVLPALFLKDGAGGLDALRRQFSRPLLVLMTLVGLILAIACANIANLLLARAAWRRREMAVRLSLGAGRRRVIRQLLTESVLLAALGGAAGAVFAWGGIGFLTLLLANGREAFPPRAGLNANVLAVTAGLSMLTGLLFGLAPALRATRVDVMPALKEAGSGQAGRRPGMDLGRLLLGGQVALSLVLLVAAGLFVRTLSNLNSVELGFNRENVLLFDVSLQATAPPGNLEAFYLDTRQRLAALPGVRGVSYSAFPLVGGGFMGFGVRIPGTEPPAERNGFLWVGPAFFETMQIPLLEGREFDDRDQAGAPRVAVVNQRFVRDYLNGGAALGRTFTASTSPEPVEIVGVAATARYGSLEGETPAVVYLPAAQGSPPRMTFEMRTAGNPTAQAGTVRRLFQQIDPRIAITNIHTQAEQIDRTINQQIVFARLCSGFAVLALLIACVGLYATTAYTVARRTSEIGIRMALGAPRARVMWMVLRQVAVLVIAGLAAGLPVTLAASRFVESFLFGMQPNDPLTLAGAAAVLVAAALLAAYAPARRASCIDPVTALRHE